MFDRKGQHREAATPEVVNLIISYIVKLSEITAINVGIRQIWDLFHLLQHNVTGLPPIHTYSQLVFPFPGQSQLYI